MSADSNPFIYSHPVAPEDLIDRDDEVERLLAAAVGGHFVRLYAPRKYGKTSLLRRVLRDAERQEGMVPILVDLYGVLSLADVTVRFERAYARQLKGKMRARIEEFLQSTGLGLSLGAFGVSARLQLDPRSDPLPALHALLDLPLRLEESGGFRALIVLDEFQDVTKVKEMDAVLRSHIQFQGELEKLSLTDSLTGLYNRRHLMGTLASEVQRSRRLRRSFTVLLADVDRFKQYNDTHGHLAGDGALVKVAEVFRKTTRQVDCVARYGGEEFVVMLLECTMATAAIVGERIRSRVAEQDLGLGSLTVSIGLAEYPEGGETPEELIASADAAMYQAKSAGRNQVVIAGVSQQRKEDRKPARRKREA